MTMSHIRTIHLHGALGKKYGHRHQLVVSTPAEAVRALNANYPGFADEILELGCRGYAYRVLHGKKASIGLNTAEELHDPASGDIRIIPEIAGAKKGGLGQLIAGIAMIAAVYFTGGAAAGAWGTSVLGTTTTVGNLAMNIGLSMALTGVVQMLASTTNSSQASEDKSNPSYIFDGAVNTMAQGHPVPVGYGEMIVGSAVISAGVDIDQVVIPVDPTEAGPTWTNPATGNVEAYPPPTLVWDQNLNNWTLPDGAELLYDSTYGHDGGHAEGGNWVETRSNFRMADGRAPILTASPNRWDIPDATVFATPGKHNGAWVWFIRSGTVRIAYLLGEKRFEVVGGGDTSGGDGNEGTVGNDGDGVSAGDGNAGDGGTGGGDGSGSGGGTGTA